MIRAIDKRSREAIGASYALPDLLVAVREVIYNSLDAGALSVRVFVDTAEGSFSVVDDGEGIAPDDLSKLVGECTASSRLSGEGELAVKCNNEFYGSRGEALRSLVSIAASMEIESRVPDQWSSHRKVFESGKVVFNAHAKDVRPAAGTTVKVRQLFHSLPVRKKKLSQDAKYQTRISEDIKAMMMGTALMWPSVAFELKFQHSSRQAVIFPAVRHPQERICAVFGGPLGMELQEFNVGDEAIGYLIRGYFTLIPDEWGAASPGIKQAQTFYQYVFFDRRWNECAHKFFGNTITQACIASGAGIPIFVLNINRGKATLDDGYDKNVLQEICSCFMKAVEGLEKEKEKQSGTARYSNRLVAERWAMAALYADTPTYLVNQQYESGMDACDGSEVYQLEMNGSASRDSCHEFETWQEVGEEPAEHAVSDAFVSAWAADESFDRNIELEQLQEGYHEDYESIELRLGSACHECGRSDSSYRFETAENAYSCVGSKSHYEASFETDSSQDSRENWILDGEISSKNAIYPAGPHGVEENIFFPVSVPTNLLENNPLDLDDLEGNPWLSSHTAFTVSCKNPTRAFESEFRDVAYASIGIEPTVDNGESLQAQISNGRKESAENVRIRKSESNFFTSRSSRMSTKPRCARLLVTPMESLGDRMQVQALYSNTTQKTVKLNRAVLDKITFVRQVDRKFILVSASYEERDRQSSAELLLCIDQHAADERVRLEKLEAEMFGRDGCSRNFDIQEHNPALLMLLNSSERSIVEANHGFLRSWGFDIQFCPQSQWSRFSKSHSIAGDDSGGRYLLRTSPRVENRVANADDLREFLQELSITPSNKALSVTRPPVITRFLHSRACRSAIMFGDYMSISQCKELLEELRNCQLPFQCAHGRPSVVPLAEFMRDNSSKQ